MCAAGTDSSGNGWTIITNNFTSSSFDIVYTKVGTGNTTAILEIDVTG